MLQHGAAVSGASVALSGLGNRLESLVEALVTSYSISERDLEVNVIIINSIDTLNYVQDFILPFNLYVNKYSKL